MKNKAILISLLLLSCSLVFAQDSKFKLGIRFAPGISFNKVEDVDDSDNLDFTSNGVGIRYSAGIFGDFFFGKNYAFHSGIWYTVNRMGMKYSSTNNVYGKGEAAYNVQHIQIPIALKLLTNDVSTDMKLYFTLGGTLGIAINEKRVDWKSSEYNNPFDQGYPLGNDIGYFSRPGGSISSFGDVGLLVGFGTEYQLAESTIIFAGLVYTRGLTNVSSNKGMMTGRFGEDAGGHYKINNQFFGLEIGLKF